MRLTQTERDLVAEIDFDNDVCQLIKNALNKPLERALRFGPDGAETPANGLSVRCVPDVLAGFVHRYQAYLRESGYSTFWSVRSEGRRPRDEMVVLKTADDREILRWRATAANVRGLTTDEILAELDRWSALCRLQVIGASHDWLALNVETLPENICAFAEMVYKICPNTVDRGTALEREADDRKAFAAARKLCKDPKVDIAVKLLAYNIAEYRSIFLWWD